ncbi:hypothetical protein AALO_G00173160 [Alosa alosa]|uniref:Uncharacterized protein n=1 Tax=Alosa alosa TaxID=278164 RepID=A0AAV6G6V6_9TELE|nr:hypothetical protein AALO_G00173160 [Alosa alosa]
MQILRVDNQQVRSGANQRVKIGQEGTACDRRERSGVVLRNNRPTAPRTLQLERVKIGQEGTACDRRERSGVVLRNNRPTAPHTLQLELSHCNLQYGHRNKPVSGLMERLWI